MATYLFLSRKIKVLVYTGLATQSRQKPSTDVCQQVVTHSNKLQWQQHFPAKLGENPGFRKTKYAFSLGRNNDECPSATHVMI